MLGLRARQMMIVLGYMFDMLKGQHTGEEVTRTSDGNHTDMRHGTNEEQT